MRTRNLMLSLLDSSRSTHREASTAHLLTSKRPRLNWTVSPGHFCAYGLEKKLKKVEAVEKLKIHVKQGSAKLAVKKGRAISVEAVENAVEDAPFYAVSDLNDRGWPTRRVQRPDVAHHP